jgi:MFS family permease
MSRHPLTSSQSSATSPKSEQVLFVLCAAVFLSYLTISLPLPAIPIYVHDALGFSDVLVGLTIGIQFLATVLTRGYAGRLADHRGAKRSMLQGIGSCIGAGTAYLLAALLPVSPAVGLVIVIAGRLILGFGESQLMVGMLAWAIGTLGQARAGKVLAWTGMAMYTSLAIGAPVGLALYHAFGFIAVGGATVVLPLIALLLAAKVAGVAPHGGARQPFHHILGLIWRPGLGVALQGVGFAAIGAFVSLDFTAHGWSGAGLALSCFGAAFVGMRLVCGHLPDRLGGGLVALVSLGIEAGGQLLLWNATTPNLALLGAAVTGLGCSMVFPSLGIEIVKRVPPQSRATALGGFSAFQDIAYAVTGPVTGLVAGSFGYPSVFIVGAFAALLGMAAIFPMRHR